MKELTIEEIGQFYDVPLIGVIGAASPTPEYKEERGIELGYLLREFVESSKGTIFTGGVSGVGIDVYSGIVKFCRDESMKQGKIVDDKFFILIPSHEIMGEPIFKYNPPYEYAVLGRLNQTSELVAVRAGQNMAERRKYFAEIADKIVVVNGGYGTLDEALCTLKLGKEIISVSSSGGAAAVLKLLKEKELSRRERRKIMRAGLSLDDLDFSLVRDVSNIEDIKKYL